MKVAVIGIGHVGLVTGLSFAMKGNIVTCLEKNEKIRNDLNSGISHIFEPGIEELLQTILADRTLTVRPSESRYLTDSDVIFICVNTPVGPQGIDFDQLREALETVGKAIAETGKFITIVIKSTVLPGTTDGLVREIIEASSGKKCSLDFGLAANPEFLREGNGIDDFLNSDRIVIGSTDIKTQDILLSLYDTWVCERVLVNNKTAEFIKYFNNNLLSLIISFSNEMSNIARNIEGIDFKAAIHGITRDQRLNPIKADNSRVDSGILSYLVPGPGFGGSCLPKDLEAFAYFSHNKGFNSPLLDGIIETNANQPSSVIKLMEKHIGNLAGKKVLVLGLAHKPNTNDTRQSAALKMVELLQRKSALLALHDPVVSEVEINHLLEDNLKTTYTRNWKQALGDTEVVLLMTPWDEYKAMEGKGLSDSVSGKYIVDTRFFFNRNAFSEGFYVSL